VIQGGTEQDQDHPLGDQHPVDEGPGGGEPFGRDTGLPASSVIARLGVAEGLLGDLDEITQHREALDAARLGQLHALALVFAAGGLTPGRELREVRQAPAEDDADQRGPHLCLHARMLIRTPTVLASSTESATNSGGGRRSRPCPQPRSPCETLSA
jgi:hypothetical protein